MGVRTRRSPPLRAGSDDGSEAPEADTDPDTRNGSGGSGGSGAAPTARSLGWSRAGGDSGPWRFLGSRCQGKRDARLPRWLRVGL